MWPVPKGALKDGALFNSSRFNPSQWLRAAIAAGGKPCLIRLDGGGIGLACVPSSQAAAHPFILDGNPDRWAVIDVLYRTGRAFGVKAGDMDAERIRMWAPEDGSDAGLIALVRDYHAAGAGAAGIPMDTPGGEKDADLLFRRQDDAFFRLAAIIPRTPAGVVAKLSVLNDGWDDLTVAEAEALKMIVSTCIAAIEGRTGIADDDPYRDRDITEFGTEFDSSVAGDRGRFAIRSALPALNNCEIDAALASVLQTSANGLSGSLDRLIESGSFTAEDIASFRAWVRNTSAGEREKGKQGKECPEDFPTEVTPQSLQALSDRQDAIVGLMRRHRRLGPAIFDFLEAGNYLPMTLLLTVDHGGPLVWRFIGSGIVAFGPDWARERIGQPYDVGDPFADFSSVIDATYAAAIGSGEAMTNHVVAQLDPLPGAFRGLVSYRQLLLPLRDSDGGQALLIHAEMCSDEPSFTRVRRRPGRTFGNGALMPRSGRLTVRREPGPISGQFPWIGKGGV